VRVNKRDGHRPAGLAALFYTGACHPGNKAKKRRGIPLFFCGKNLGWSLFENGKTAAVWRLGWRGLEEKLGGSVLSDWFIFFFLKFYILSI